MSQQLAGTYPVDDLVSRTQGVLDDLRHLEGPLLPILHAIQDEFGFVPQGSLPIIAQALNISRAEVYGVTTFYHDYRKAPAGRHVLKLCQAEACQSMGSAEVLEKAKAKFGIGLHETTSDGVLTIEPVYCLGLCACSPNAMLDGEVYGRVDDDVLDEIEQAVRA